MHLIVPNRCRTYEKFSLYLNDSFLFTRNIFLIKEDSDYQLHLDIDHFPSLLFLNHHLKNDGIEKNDTSCNWESNE